jgi:hypothetical protein
MNGDYRNSPAKDRPINGSQAKDLGPIAATFLGEGNWRPDRKAGRVCPHR